MPINHLIIFAKYWQPGAVKTRLARIIGPTAASELSRLFLQHLLERFASVADRRSVAFAPPEMEPAFRNISGPNWTLEPQIGSDLGERLRNHFHRAFAAGAQNVLVIGSDSPTLPLPHLDQAWRSLQQGASVVLGPTTDGGYYLVGARDRAPPIFQNIPWSTSQVFSRTLEILQASCLPYVQLPQWYDVDEHADLKRLLMDLEQSDEPLSSTGTALRSAVRLVVH